MLVGVAKHKKLADLFNAEGSPVGVPPTVAKALLVGGVAGLLH